MNATNETKSFEVLQEKISAHSGHPSDDPCLFHADEASHGVIGIDGRCNAAQLRLIAQWLDDACDVKATLIRFPDGDARREDPLESVQVPDLWHTAELLDTEGYGATATKVRDCWHLAHDMLRKLQRDAGIGI